MCWERWECSTRKGPNFYAAEITLALISRTTVINTRAVQWGPGEVLKITCATYVIVCRICEGGEPELPIDGAGTPAARIGTWETGRRRKRILTQKPSKKLSMDRTGTYNGKGQGVRHVTAWHRICNIAPHPMGPVCAFPNRYNIPTQDTHPPIPLPSNVWLHSTH
jgi:hypothetical protein